MPRSSLPSSKNKFVLSLGLILIVFILPISMAALYRATNYTPKATGPEETAKVESETQEPLPTPTPTAAPQQGQLWVWDFYGDSNEAKAVQVVIFDTQAPKKLTVRSFNYNPLTNSKQPVVHEAEGNCSHTQCFYYFPVVNSAQRKNFWQYWELDPAINSRYKIFDKSDNWTYDNNATFNRSSIYIGDNMPNPKEFPYYPLKINDNLADEASINFTLSRLHSQRVNDGWAMGFKFKAKMEQKLHILAQESDNKNIGSYIRTYLYGPDGKLVFSRDTRINEILDQSGEYYLVVKTFGGKEGAVSLAAYDVDAWEKNAMIQFAIDNNFDNTYETDLLFALMAPGGPWKYRFGRKPFKMRLVYPELTSISQKSTGPTPYTVEWLGKQFNEGDKKITFKKALHQSPIGLERTCYGGQSTESVDFKLKKVEDGKSAIMTRPDGSPFAPGYRYRLVSPHDYNWSFEMVASAGLIADVDGNSTVDMMDYSYLTNEIFKNNQILLTDFDCSGEVDMMDYTILLSQLGQEAVSPTPAPRPFQFDQQKGEN